MPLPAAPPSHIEDHLGYWLRFVSNHVSYAFRRKVEARGVTLSEWVILRELYRCGRTSPSAVARTMGMTRGAVSKLVDRLQTKALVTRSFSEHDRRQQQIGLTAEGNRLVPELARLADENDDAFFGHLEPRRREAIAAAMKEIVRIHQMKTVPVD
ncbi:MAG: MarR family winged helix-turn-helix transcriptional regulator [Pseudomonadota bacterium]